VEAIRTATRLLSAVAAAGAMLAGCAIDTGDVRIKVDVGQAVASDAPRVAKVQVTDIRREANLERKTIGGISMGRVTLQPAEAELVQAMVEAQAAQVLAGLGKSEPQTVLCGIRVFDVVTPATALYWDIETRIELVLRVRGQDRTVAAMATERTYAWPSSEIIGRVTGEAMRRIGIETGRALEALFALPR
jgi:hypothetical protein